MTDDANQLLLAELRRLTAAVERLAGPAPAENEWNAADCFVWAPQRSHLQPVKRPNRVALSLIRGVDHVRDILHETGIPAIYVTHDQEEAFTLADRLALLVDGKIIQEGAPQQVFQAPVSEKAARFLGQINFLRAKPRQEEGKRLFKTVYGDFVVQNAPSGLPDNGRTDVLLCLRKAQATGSSEPAGNAIPCRVQDSIFSETGFITTLTATDGSLYRFLLDKDYAAGDQVKLIIPPEEINVFPAEDHVQPDNY